MSCSNYEMVDNSAVNYEICLIRVITMKTLFFQSDLCNEKTMKACDLYF